MSVKRLSPPRCRWTRRMLLFVMLVRSQRSSRVHELLCQANIRALERDCSLNCLLNHLLRISADFTPSWSGNLTIMRCTTEKGTSCSDILTTNAEMNEQCRSNEFFRYHQRTNLQVLILGAQDQEPRLYLIHPRKYRKRDYDITKHGLCLKKTLIIESMTRWHDTNTKPMLTSFYLFTDWEIESVESDLVKTWIDQHYSELD